MFLVCKGLGVKILLDLKVGCMKGHRGVVQNEIKIEEMPTKED